jgi:hypothetical protein
MASFCEHGNGTFCSIKGVVLLDQLSDYRLSRRVLLLGVKYLNMNKEGCIHN